MKRRKERQVATDEMWAEWERRGEVCRQLIAEREQARAALDEASAERNDLRARIAELTEGFVDLVDERNRMVDQLAAERRDHHEALSVALEHNERLRNDLAGQQSLHRTREAQIDEMRRQRNELELGRKQQIMRADIAASQVETMDMVGDRLAADATPAMQREWEAAKEGRLLRVNGRFVKQS